MRIGIVTRRVGFNDGQGRVNLEIAREALRQGHSVTLFCEQADAALVGDGAVPRLAPPSPIFPSRILKDQVFACRTKLRLTLQASQFDAVLSNGFATWAPSDVNAVHFVHASWLRSPYHPWRQKAAPITLYRLLHTELNARLERGAFQRSGAVVAVSEKVRTELVEIGVPAERITTIINGVDSDEFSPGPSQRARYGLPSDVRLGLFAGDLKTSRKNLDTVFRAMARVPGLHLAVAGRHEGTPWPAMARDIGIADRVHFLGFQNDMPSLMRSVDMFVFPSRYEACSLVLLEALASGLPVVTAASAGGAELVTANVGMVLANSDDDDALAAALSELAGSETRRSQMSAQARAVGTRHSWAAMARQYLHLLQQAGAARLAQKTGQRSGVPAHA